MARDDRRQPLTPRELAEQDIAASRELVGGGALSAGERAVALAGLAQARAVIGMWDLLAERLPAGGAPAGDGLGELPRELRDLGRTMTMLATALADSQRR